MEQEENDQALSNILTDHFSEMANALEEFLKKARDEVVEERKQNYTPHIERLQNELNQKLEEFAQMQGDSAQVTNELVKEEAYLTRLINLRAKLSQKVRNANNESRTFNAWKQLGTDTPILTKVFKRTFVRNCMRRIYFRRWVRKTHVKRENRIVNEIKKRYDKIWKAKALEAQKTIEDLESELAEARDELESKQENFIEMQRRLRKAFMRGVVNLNLEAMDVFNGAQFMDLMQEVEGNEVDHQDTETAVNESDDDFFVEEDPQISVIRHH